jgi:hypothetical protein
MSAARKYLDHPELFVLPDAMADLSLPSLPQGFTAPRTWTEDVTLKTSKGTEKKRFGSFSAARRLLDCEPLKLRTILRTGLIYAYKGTDHEKSWWCIDLAGIYLYRENQRRRAIGLPATPAWTAYSAHMTALNAESPDVAGPPPV